MDRLDPFTVVAPRSLAEASACLAAAPQARALAGGTDLVPNVRHGLESPATLVDLTGIDALRALSLDGERVTLGAAVTLATLASDARVRERLPALAEAAASIAGPGHRSAATLGGNLCLDTRCVFYNQSAWWRAANGHCLKRGGTTCHVAPQGQRCHAAYSGDLAPALIALDARVVVNGAHGERAMPLAQLYRDDGAAHLSLDAGDVVVRVELPVQPAGARSGYRKARVRGAIDFPLAGVAVRVVIDCERIADLRIAITGTNTHPVQLDGTEALRGERVDAALLERVGKLVQRQAAPMRTTVTAANHRRRVAVALARRLVADLAAAPV